MDAEAACRRLDGHLAELGMDAPDDLLDRRDEFVASHALLAAAAGGVMPHVYLIKEGPSVHITWREPGSNGSDVAFHEPHGQACVSADVLLDSVADFLQWCGEMVAMADPAFAAEIEEWLAQIDRPEAAEAVLQGYIRPWGVSPAPGPLQEVLASLGLPDGWRSAGARLDPGRMPAAVVFRALAPVLRDDDVVALLERLRTYPSVLEAGRNLQALRAGLVLPSQEVPHLQGYGLAEQLRAAEGNRDGFFDVELFLGRLGVRMDGADLSDPEIDAATVWSEAHGPVIVLNQQGARQQPWACRMVLAHELCHLLVDRQAAAELMVASTPWAPPDIERRANAFAAELLLPKAGILRVAGDAVRRGWVGEEMRQLLMGEFQVGATVCSHQLENRLRLAQ
ncbi:MAG: ImmA/IrrE family metallo-endopeptidase [Candidatus Latescibacterota bacterium]